MNETTDHTQDEEQMNEAKPEDKWYFVDDSIKDRLGGGDGPSFSVASLFSSKSEVFSKPEEPVTDTQPPTISGSGSTTIWKKESLFILDPHDSRTAGVGRFFDVRPLDTDSKDLIKRRREISLIVQSKFKRVERNQDKIKTGPSRYTNPRRKFKKQKT